MHYSSQASEILESAPQVEHMALAAIEFRERAGHRRKLFAVIR